MLRVQAVSAMDDETFISHLELRHSEDLRMRWRIEPGRSERRILARSAWEVYHRVWLHRGAYWHEHA